jgi:iron-sulfur cluster assembly protein
MITITERAAEAIKASMADEKLIVEDNYLRVAVKGGGCSGMSYDLGFDNAKKVGDIEIEKDGIRLLVGLKSQVFLAGTTLDFSAGLNGRGFVFTNPNAAGSCGCGESFSV